jgi:cyclophilin family peptidyl-prolyl cis-trans isomerase
VGTNKRQRQKAGRQSRRVEAETAAKKARTRSTLIRWGIFAAIVIGIIVAFSVFRGGDETATPPATTTPVPTTTVPAYGSAPCPPEGGSAEPLRQFDAPFQNCIDPTKSYAAVITTNKGELRVALDAAGAPATVNNFVNLSKWRFYDGLSCHRIIPDFVAQCGDPKGDGTGGPGYRFADELPERGEYRVGSLAMANSGANTNGSQFFIITGAQGVALPPNYSLFGQVEPGQDAVIEALDGAGNPDPGSGGVPPKEPVTIESVRIVVS